MSASGMSWPPLRTRRARARCGAPDCEASRHGLLHQPLSPMPRGGVGITLAQSGVGAHEGAGSLVGVVVVGAKRAEGRAADAALACAVDAGKNVDVWCFGRSHRSFGFAPRRAVVRLLAPLGCRLDRCAAQSGRRGIEGRRHAPSSLGRLHAHEQTVELCAQIVESGGARLDQ